MLSRSGRNAGLVQVARSQLCRPVVRNPYRRYASVTDIESYPQPGETLHGFTLKEKKHVPELHLTALQLEHDKTGAEYLHVARDDKNNVFAINFKTNPVDRTGLPHILEHVTLCGSEKFPVRDPFFKMMPRSLANFMNAFTSSDYTSYPFATTNAQDFRNLASVYLDATLHPLLKKTDFLQEGWRLGPENPRETATNENVKFKGVVYNEMKGQMSDASYLYYIRFREHMFPTLENSGGDPEKMTDLTHETLVKFSKEHYHPSNAKIFTYGDMSLRDHLRQVDETLSKFTRTNPDTDLKEPIDLSDGLVSYEVQGPLDTMQPADKQVKSSVTWTGCQTSDIVENFSLSIMLSLLMSGYGSPLYQGLIESGLGTNFSPNSGYDSAAKTAVMSIGLDGMRLEDVQNLKQTIQKVLREKGSEAFRSDKVEGYLHQLEIALKHKTASFGMGLLDKTLPGWLNGTSPMASLSWNDVIDAFKDRLSKGKYLEDLLQKYLLVNDCMQFTMTPSATYSAELEANEEKRRRSILQAQSTKAGSLEDVFQKLSQQELELLAEQESGQTKNLETLPSLHVQDIPKTKEAKSIRWEENGHHKTLWRETDTNGITYFQLKNIFTDLPDELRLLLPLFTDSLMRLGTRTLPVGDLEAQILLKTGGISISPFTNPSIYKDGDLTEGIMLQGYALERNVPAMLDLMRQVMLEADFSAEHAAPAILELLESKTSGALDSVAEAGHHFAVSSAAVNLSERARRQEQLSGLSQIECTSKLLALARKNPEALTEIIRRLQQIQAFALTNSAGLSTRFVCEPHQTTANQQLLATFLQSLPKQAEIGSNFESLDYLPNSTFARQTYFNLPFQVFYTGTCLRTAPYESPDKAHLTILAQLLTHKFLHPEVREKGGAYGASGSASPMSDLFTMSSYRDPNPRNSLATFNRAGIFARDRAWTDRELEESKLSLFQQIDAPRSVSSDGSKEFMYGITQEMDQKRREQLLSVTKDDVKRVAQRYMIEGCDQNVSTAILGEKKDWVEEDKSWYVRGLSLAV